MNPSLTIAPGKSQLWRLANTEAHIFYELRLDDHAFHGVAEDGNSVWRVSAADSHALPPGKRFDVLVQGTSPGTHELIVLTYDLGGGTSTRRSRWPPSR